MLRTIINQRLRLPFISSCTASQINPELLIRKPKTSVLAACHHHDSIAYSFSTSPSSHPQQQSQKPTEKQTESSPSSALKSSLSQQTPTPTINEPQQIDTIPTQEQLQEQALQRQKALQKRHTELQQKIDKQIKLPLKLYGTKDKFEEKFSYLPSRIRSYYRIHPDTITDYLLKIYKASLYAMIDQNQEFMNEYWEDGFREKIVKMVKEVKQKGYHMEIKEDNNFLMQMRESCQILDEVCVRGLSMNRQDNQHPNDYRKSEQNHEVGLITYTPLYLTENNEKFINPQTNKNVYEGYQKMTLRILLRIRTPLRFNVQQIPVEDDIYTWEHLCVFENEMLAPKHLESRYKLETLMEWLGKYRFGVWKVVDMDNVMRGNSLFRKHESGEEEEIDPILKGTIFDKDVHVDIRRF